MGKDKAFLLFKGKTFISLIVGEVAKVSDEIVVSIGSKSSEAFEKVLPPTVSILPDSYHIANPMGGMISAFDHVTNAYAAVVACDLPLLHGEVLRFLFSKALCHSAAVPRWENGYVEPSAPYIVLGRALRLLSALWIQAEWARGRSCQFWLTCNMSPFPT